jgi:outer membrane receptor protein involved in Fe transport
LFVGDAGTTEASRPSRRTGIEATAYFRPRPWLIFDGDLAVSRSRFTDDDPARNRIPGAVGTVVSAGVALDGYKGAFGSMRLRYFGPRPLIEDDSVRSMATSLVNLQAGYRFSPGVRLFLDVFNLFDSDASDIDYFYASRLPGEPAGGIEDIHMHPTLPRTLRLGLQLGF